MMVHIIMMNHHQLVIDGAQVEMDSIVDQMMSVAEMLGWETNELRPVRSDHHDGDDLAIVRRDACL